MPLLSGERATETRATKKMEHKPQILSIKCPETCIEAALYFHRLGFNVLPLGYGQKIPAIKKWKKYQTERQSEDEVRSLFAGKLCNIGLLMGSVCNLIAVDLDSLEAIAWAKANLPHTPLMSQSRNGQHWLYKRGSLVVKNKTKIRVDGDRHEIDFRSDGGYITSPFSLHPNNSNVDSKIYNKMSATDRISLAERDPVFYSEINPWVSSNSSLIPDFPPLLLKDSAKTDKNVNNEQRGTTNLDQKLEKKIRARLSKTPHAVQGDGGDEATFKVACDLNRGFMLADDIAMVFFKTWNDRCSPPWSDEELLAKLRSAAANGSGSPGYLLYGGTRPNEYAIEGNTIARVAFAPDGSPYNHPLCNFVAKISVEETHDDGTYTNVVYKIDGKDSEGAPLGALYVSAESFPSLSWVQAWGHRAVIFAGNAVRDHLRVAIQMLSEDVEVITKYSHTGWRKVGDNHIFLVANGAILHSGLDTAVNVKLAGENLSRVSLPPPPAEADLRAAVCASMRLLSVAPPAVGFALIAATYLAPLNEFIPIDFSVFLLGSTGVHKSELAAAMQAHFGAEFDRLNLPGNWSSSPNALEMLAFLFKDCVFVIDDYVTVGSRYDADRLNRTADRVLRGQGNKSGRSRMAENCTDFRREHFARCLAVSTGEELPNGQSLRARLHIVQLSPGDVNLGHLTELQADARGGVLASAMSGYLSWLSSRADFLKKELPAEKQRLRAELLGTGCHSRTPEVIAQLLLGLRSFLSYAEYADAVTSTEATALMDKGREALVLSSKVQVAHQDADNPANRFFELFNAAIIAGKAYLSGVDNGGYQFATPNIGGNSGELAGWILNDEVLLEPEVSFSVAQKMARDSGEPPLCQKFRLREQLANMGLIAAEGEGSEWRNTLKRTVPQFGRPRVMVLTEKGKNLLVGDSPGAAGASGARGANAPNVRPFPSPENSKPTGTAGHCNGA